MKSALVTLDWAYYERIIATFNRLNCRSLTYWEQVRGRGPKTEEPHYGSYAWLSMYPTVLAMMKNERVGPLLEVLHNVDKRTEQLGLRAFVWNIKRTI